jgi:hypothetical protein
MIELHSDQFVKMTDVIVELIHNSNQSVDILAANPGKMR